MSLTEVERDAVECIDLPQDKNKWQAVVMKIRTLCSFSLNEAILLTNG
jgi:hypothetical protein